MLSLMLRIAILLVVTFAYAILDVFNHRNVPDIFAYALLALAFIVTLTYGTRVMLISLALAAVIGAIGYLLYRKGVMGAGDFLEFATISMLIPIQPSAFLSSMPQFNFPFIFSVFIATGYTAVVGMLFYYLLRAYLKGSLKSVEIEKKRLYNGILIFAAYLVMLAAVSYIAGPKPIPAVMVITIGAASALTIIFEKQVSVQMISYVYPAALTTEDMIATNFMSKEDLAFFSRRSKHFGRLVTKKSLEEIKGIRKKVPLYTSGVPLALFAFFAVVISLLFGNILLYLLI